MSGTALVRVNICAKCNGPALFACSCLQLYYCSRECQMADWFQGGHKLRCEFKRNQEKTSLGTSTTTTAVYSTSHIQSAQNTAHTYVFTSSASECATGPSTPPSTVVHATTKTTNRTPVSTTTPNAKSTQALKYLPEPTPALTSINQVPTVFNNGAQLYTHTCDTSMLNPAIGVNATATSNGHMQAHVPTTPLADRVPTHTHPSRTHDRPLAPSTSQAKMRMLRPKLSVTSTSSYTASVSPLGVRKDKGSLPIQTPNLPTTQNESRLYAPTYTSTPTSVNTVSTNTSEYVQNRVQISAQELQLLESLPDLRASTDTRTPVRSVSLRMPYVNLGVTTKKNSTSESTSKPTSIDMGASSFAASKVEYIRDANFIATTSTHKVTPKSNLKFRESCVLSNTASSNVDMGTEEPLTDLEGVVTNARARVRIVQAQKQLSPQTYKITAFTKTTVEASSEPENDISVSVLKHNQGNTESVNAQDATNRPSNGHITDQVCKHVRELDGKNALNCDDRKLNPKQSIFDILVGSASGGTVGSVTGQTIAQTDTTSCGQQQRTTHNETWNTDIGRETAGIVASVRAGLDVGGLSAVVANPQQVSVRSPVVAKHLGRNRKKSKSMLKARTATVNGSWPDNDAPICGKSVISISSAPLATIYVGSSDDTNKKSIMMSETVRRSVEDDILSLTSNISTSSSPNTPTCVAIETFSTQDNDIEKESNVVVAEVSSSIGGEQLLKNKSHIEHRKDSLIKYSLNAKGKNSNKKRRVESANLRSNMGNYAFSEDDVQSKNTNKKQRAESTTLRSNTSNSAFSRDEVQSSRTSTYALGERVLCCVNVDTDVDTGTVTNDDNAELGAAPRQTTELTSTAPSKVLSCLGKQVNPFSQTTSPSCPRNSTSALTETSNTTRTPTGTKRLLSSSISTVNCTHCDQRFDSSSGLELHMATHKVDFIQTEDNVSDSLIASKRSTKRARTKTARPVLVLGQSVGTSTLASPTAIRGEYQCSWEGCGELFSHVSSLNVHRRAHTGELPFVCEVESCSMRFISATKRNMHMRIHAGIQRYPCTWEGCGKKFTTAGNRKQHMNVHTGDASFNCTFEDCDARYMLVSDLKAHVQKHEGKCPYVCTWDSCEQQFAFLPEKNAHVELHIRDMPFSCTWKGCSKRFNQAHKMTRHLRTHTGENTLVCEWEGCGKRCIDASNLRIHMRSHTGDTPYACTWVGCNKRFAQLSSQTRHTKTHTGDKPFSCPWEGCDMRFTQKIHQSRHVSLHTEAQTDYICPWDGCGLRFTKSYGRTVHLRTHTGGTPFECTYDGCEERFSTLLDRRIHSDSHLFAETTASGLPDEISQTKVRN